MTCECSEFFFKIFFKKIVNFANFLNDFYRMENNADFIKKNIDIVKVLSDEIKIIKRGKNFIARCPLHADNNPSLVIYPDTQSWYCFGCGKGGDVLNFLMLYKKLSFTECIDYISKKFNLNISKKIDKPQSPLYAFLNSCHAKLFKSAPEKAVLFLLKKKITEQAAKEFLIGYCDAEKSIFKNRIIIPIFNESNILCGFAGRAIDDHDHVKPKYINSPNSATFQKNNLLFNLNKAKEFILKNDSVILVEGYFDAIVLYSYTAIKNVVGLMGTNLAQQQIDLIKKYTKNVYILFDSDDAGKAATVRASLLLDKNGLNVFVPTFNDGDPDDFILKYGSKSLEKILNYSLPFAVWYVEFWLLKNKAITDAQKINIAQSCFKILAELKNKMQNHFAIKRLSELLNIDFELTLKDYKEYEYKLDNKHS